MISISRAAAASAAARAAVASSPGDGPGGGAADASPGSLASALSEQTILPRDLGSHGGAGWSFVCARPARAKGTMAAGSFGSGLGACLSAAWAAATSGTPTDARTPTDDSVGDEAAIMAGLGMDDTDADDACTFEPLLPVLPPRVAAPPRPRLPPRIGDSSGTEAGAAGAEPLAAAPDVDGGVAAVLFRPRLMGILPVSAPKDARFACAGEPWYCPR